MGGRDTSYWSLRVIRAVPVGAAPFRGHAHVRLRRGATSPSRGEPLIVSAVHRLPRRLTIAVAVAGLLAVTAGGPVGAAYRPSATLATNKVHACVNKRTHLTRLVTVTTRGRACYTWEIYVTWFKTGATGPQGAAGAQGPQGAVGPAGAQGPQGAQGPAGPAGADGAPGGPAGADGAPGPQGPAGPAGADGAVGPQGPAGPAGADGADGAAGSQGPAGADGAVGPQGPAGPAGADGADGAAGPQGPAGPAGADGATGPAGATGAQGPAGPIGPAGESLAPRTIVTSSVVTSASNVASATASATCPAGTVMLSGGGTVTTTDSLSKVQLTSSYPSSTSAWTVVGAAR